MSEVTEAELSAAAHQLRDGLHVAADVTRGRRRLTLMRTHDTPPSDQEAVTCARHAGWSAWDTRAATSRTGAPLLVLVERHDFSEIYPVVLALLWPAEREAMISDILGLAAKQDVFWTFETAQDRRRAALEAMPSEELLAEHARSLQFYGGEHVLLARDSAGQLIATCADDWPEADVWRREQHRLNRSVHRTGRAPAAVDVPLELGRALWREKGGEG